jgi:hypothetical protein
MTEETLDRQMMRDRVRRQATEESLDRQADRDRMKREDDLRMTALTQHPMLVHMQLQASTAAVQAVTHSSFGSVAPLPATLLPPQATTPHQTTRLWPINKQLSTTADDVSVVSSATDPAMLKMTNNVNVATSDLNSIDAEIAELKRKMGLLNEENESY